MDVTHKATGHTETIGVKADCEPIQEWVHGPRLCGSNGLYGSYDWAGVDCPECLAIGGMGRGE